MPLRPSLAAPALTAALALAAGLALSTPAPAASGPTAAQIRAAVRRAERSPDLWATVNVCDAPSKAPAGNKLLGVRVQMPALGFTSTLYMDLRIEYWSAAQKRFLRTQSRYGPKSFGVTTHLAHQGGHDFAFTPPPAGATYLLRGVATLEWRIGTRVLGHVVRTTRHGYRHVDFSNPPGYSAATCTISAAKPAGTRGPTHAIAANSRGSLVITPVTPIASSARSRGNSSTVHT